MIKNISPEILTNECTHYPIRHFVVSGKVTELTQLENAFSISIKTGPGVVNTLQFAGADLCDMPKWLKVGVGVEFDSMTNTIKKTVGKQ